MKTRTPAAVLLLVVCLFARPTAQTLAPLPAGWPNRLELGMADTPGGAAAMKATAPFRFRYQYLAGGANTGSGWATWNTNGDFAKFYIQDSAANGIIPVFTYYMLLQSRTGGGSESDANFANLNNTATMTAYFNDVKLFFQKAGAFPSQRVVLHVEPDFWGYMEQRSTSDDADDRAGEGVRRRACRNWRVFRATSPASRGRSSSSAILYAPNVTARRITSACGAPASTSRCRIRPTPPLTCWPAAPPPSTRRWRHFRHRLRRIQRSRFRVLPVHLRRQRPLVVGCRGLPPERQIPQWLFSGDVQADCDVADSAGQHADAGAEQHERSLPGQSAGMAARRARRART